jgi:hypothetical protein
MHCRVRSMLALAPSATTTTLSNNGGGVSTSSVTAGMHKTADGTTTTTTSAHVVAWQRYWLPLLRQMCALCTDNRTDVRNAAMMILQRALLGEDLLALGSDGWYVKRVYGCV